jgi:hypothetical protein
MTMSYSLPQYHQVAFPTPLKLENPTTCISAAVVRAETISNTTNIHNQVTGILKVHEFLKVTGFIELIVGVLLVGYAQAQSVIPQCPAVPGCGGPSPDYGLYNAVGLVLVVIGLIQIAASFYMARTHSPTQHVVADSSIGTVRE